MKQYVYAPTDAGLNEWPSGTLRLTCETTTDPSEADVFICPSGVPSKINAVTMRSLPYFAGNEERHVFLHVNDDESRYGLRSIFLRCNLRLWNLIDDPNSVSQPWPVESFDEVVAIPEGGFVYDISFQGWAWHESRLLSSKSCREQPELKSDIATYTDFFGYLKPDNPEFHRRRAEFRRSMRESRIALCPEQINGVFPYRYYESLSSARCALLVGSDFVFPFADEIDYTKFTFFCPREQASNAGAIALSIVRSLSDEELIRRGRLAREAWEKWLDSRRWPELHTYAVAQKLSQQGIRLSS